MTEFCISLQVCYFRRLDPTTTDPTRFLGSVQEASLGHPVPDRVYAINHDWGTGPVFDLVAPGNGGSGNDVSGKWRGRLFFPGGNYDMTVWSSGGVRVTVDDNVVLDEWSATDGGRFAVAVSPRRGYHQVVVTWNTAGGRSALLRLHWDRLPDVANPVVSHVRIETFIVDRQDVCIAGDPWTSGTPLRVHNADGSTAEAWQIEDDRGLPVPSHPRIRPWRATHRWRVTRSATPMRRKPPSAAISTDSRTSSRRGRSARWSPTSTCTRSRER